MKHLTVLLVTGIMALGGAASAQDGSNDGARKIRDRIASIRITLDFNGARLDEVIAYVQEYSGLNFHLDSEARAKDLESGARVTIKLKDVTLKTALKLVLNPRDLGCVYRDGVIVIATKARLGTEAVTRVYDVRDLMFPIRDFEGPRMELHPPGSSKMGIIPFLSEEEPVATLNSEFLVDLIRTSTGDRSWDDTSSSSITQMNGLLVVSQSKSVHDEVRRLLDLLRQYK